MQHIFPQLPVLSVKMHLTFLTCNIIISALFTPEARSPCLSLSCMLGETYRRSFPHIPKHGGEISGRESITRCFKTRPTGIQTGGARHGGRWQRQKYVFACFGEFISSLLWAFLLRMSRAGDSCDWLIAKKSPSLRYAHLQDFFNTAVERVRKTRR